MELGSSPTIRDSDKTLIRRMYNCDETSETKKSYEDGKSSEKSDETSDDDRSSSKDVDKSDESSEEKGRY